VAVAVAVVVAVAVAVARVFQKPLYKEVPCTRAPAYRDIENEDRDTEKKDRDTKKKIGTWNFQK